MEVKEIDRILEKYGSDPADVLGMLMDIQEKERYLPREALNYLSRKWMCSDRLYPWPPFMRL